MDSKQCFMAQTVSDLEATADDLVTHLPTQLSRVETDLRALEQRFLKLIPLLSHLKRGGGPGAGGSVPGVGVSRSSNLVNNGVLSSISNGEADSISRRLESLELKFSRLTNDLLDQTARSHRPMPQTEEVVTLECQFRELQVQMKQLQLRVVGKGVQIANKTFQSFDDVKTWVSLHLPNRRYGLFVDGVSIFEFFLYGHIDAETTYSSFYSQHRISVFF